MRDDRHLEARTVRMPATALDEVALKTARRKLGAATVTRAEISETIGAGGDPILKVRLVVVPDVVRRLGGETILDTLIALSRAVEATGEERRIIVEYADQKELDELGAN